jgi:hypothetical protein
VAVVIGWLLAQIRQVEKSVNAAKHMIRGNVLIEIEGVKQSVLIAASLVLPKRTVN